VDDAPQVLRGLDRQRAQAVLDLAEAARDADGVAPLNEHTMLGLGDAGDAYRHLVVEERDRLLGYAFVDLAGNGAVGAECVVHPVARGAGRGQRLVRTALDVAGGRPVAIWAHGDLPAAAAIAARIGLRRARELRRMRRDLAQPLPSVALPDGVRLRTFDPDADQEAWVDLNARAFASHPEQGAMTIEDLRLRMAQSWFDAAGFFVAERDAELVGFHWTKVHTEQVPAFGEVYVVGVSPQAQGGGLGRALTLRGLHHLRDVGLDSVVLYVEADNEPALRVYAGLGFTVDTVDVQYRS
jgi:mycothiol synthase